MTLETTNPTWMIGVVFIFIGILYTMVCLYYRSWKKKDEGPEILHARSAVGSLVEGPLDYEEGDEEQ